MGMVARRFDVHLVRLDPTLGAEIQKTRPCLVVSPDEMNRYLRTVIVAPLTTRDKPYPSRVACRFQGKSGQVALDQLRSVDQARLAKRLGTVDGKTQSAVLSVLAEIFAP